MSIESSKVESSVVSSFITDHRIRAVCDQVLDTIRMPVFACDDKRTLALYIGVVDAELLRSLDSLAHHCCL